MRVGCPLATYTGQLAMSLFIHPRYQSISYPTHQFSALLKTIPQKIRTLKIRKRILFLTLTIRNIDEFFPSHLHLARRKKEKLRYFTIHPKKLILPQLRRTFKIICFNLPGNVSLKSSPTVKSRNIRIFNRLI